MRTLKRAYKIFIFCGIFFALISGISYGFIRDGAIRGKSGLSFSNIAYNFDSLNVTIRNTTKYNVNFGGTMIFLDRHYRVVAKAELMQAKIKRHSSRKYKGFFSEGSGHEAKSARYLEWEF